MRVDRGESRRLLCPDGHTIAVYTSETLTIKHQGRTVRIAGHSGRPVAVTVICDRCGKAANLLW